ncbi:MAG: helix-turn-helix domain-containing protein [Gammaproteobacteria bacterium]|uniref:Helix-turn-helix domain-containing protein n=1 Tax=Candidatus Thiopontia autotrophica TaxID=2841688 RepID=A0A8J6TSG6_9GAMM|nr:helix-turn-helix domain-containing protein [Candidatus Thiopontia autotrophica]
MSEKNKNGVVDQGELFEKPLGERLREARLEQGVELADVSHQLKVEESVLVAIEEGRKPPRALPDVFFKGFIRNYARYLKVETGAKETSVNVSSLGTTPPREIGGDKAERPSFDLASRLGSIVESAGNWGRSFVKDPVNEVKENPLPPVVILLSLVLVFWLLSGGDPADEQPVVVESVSTENIESGGPEATETEAAKPVKPTKPAVNDGVVTIQYIDSAWTRITDGLGRVLVKRSLDAGTIKDFKGPLPLKVDLGASRVDIKFNGKPFDFLNYINDDGTVQFVLESNE